MSERRPPALMAGAEPPEEPSWLPGGRRGPAAAAWWAELAQGVEALAERYPRALLKLPPDWWAEPALSEQLGALVVWRAAIDEGVAPPHPRVEIEFHEKLADLGAHLDARAQATLVGDPQRPGAPGEPELVARAAAARWPILRAALTRLAKGAEDMAAVSPAEAARHPRQGRPVWPEGQPRTAGLAFGRPARAAGRGRSPQSSEANEEGAG